MKARWCRWPTLIAEIRRWRVSGKAPHGAGGDLPLKPRPAPFVGIETAMPNGNRWRAFGLLGLLLLVAACAHHHDERRSQRRRRRSGQCFARQIQARHSRRDACLPERSDRHPRRRHRRAGAQKRRQQPALRGVPAAQRQAKRARIMPGSGRSGRCSWPAGSITSSIRPRRRAPAQLMCRFRSWKSFRARLDK